MTTPTQGEHAKTALAHELFAAAQIAPGEGIEDAVSRIASALTAPTAQPAAPQGVAYAELEKKHRDFVETVSLMLDAIGYKEDYARQWPKEKASITFKRWFDEQRASHGQAPAGACINCGGDKSQHNGVRCVNGNENTYFTPTEQAAPAAGAVAGMPPGISALMCVISSLRDTAHFSDEEGELTDELRTLRDWAMTQAAAPTPAAQADSQPALGLQTLHNLLYLAQRQTSMGAMQRVVGQARLELARMRDASPQAESVKAASTGELLMGLAVIRELTGTQKNDLESTVDTVRAAFAHKPARDYPPLPDLDDTLWIAIGQHRRAITNLETSVAAKAVDTTVHELLRAYVDADRAARAQADSVLEDAARWQFVESAPSPITLRIHNLRPDQREQYVDAARKQGGKHD